MAELRPAGSPADQNAPKPDQRPDQKPPGAGDQRRRPDAGAWFARNADRLADPQKPSGTDRDTAKPGAGPQSGGTPRLDVPETPDRGGRDTPPRGSSADTAAAARPDRGQARDNPPQGGSAGADQPGADPRGTADATGAGKPDAPGEFAHPAAADSPAVPDRGDPAGDGPRDGDRLPDSAANGADRPAPSGADRSHAPATTDTSSRSPDVSPGAAEYRDTGRGTDHTGGGRPPADTGAAGAERASHPADTARPMIDGLDRYGTAAGTERGAGLAPDDAPRRDGRPADEAERGARNAVPSAAAADTRDTSRPATDTIGPGGPGAGVEHAHPAAAAPVLGFLLATPRGAATGPRPPARPPVPTGPPVEVRPPEPKTNDKRHHPAQPSPIRFPDKPWLVWRPSEHGAGPGHERSRAPGPHEQRGTPGTGHGSQAAPGPSAPGKAPQTRPRPAPDAAPQRTPDAKPQRAPDRGSGHQPPAADVQRRVEAVLGFSLPGPAAPEAVARAGAGTAELSRHSHDHAATAQERPVITIPEVTIEGHPVVTIPEVTVRGSADPLTPTPFEDWVAEHGRPGEYRQNRDPESGEPTGFTHNKGSGYWENTDRDGRVISSGELPLDKPAVDPIDFVPGPGEAAVLGKVFAETVGKAAVDGAGRVLAREIGRLVGRETTEAATKAAGDVAAESLGKTAAHETAQREGHQAADVVFRSPEATPQPGTYVESGPGRSHEAKAAFGESTMAFDHGKEGWTFLDGPSGAAGHAWNAPGFDAAAFRITDAGKLEIRIMDNKAYASARNIGDASALTRNLPQNLDDLARQVAGQRYDQVPRIAEIRRTLDAARDAAHAGQPLPTSIELTVTGYGGKSGDVTKALRDKGVTFRRQP